MSNPSKGKQRLGLATMLDKAPPLPQCLTNLKPQRVHQYGAALALLQPEGHCYTALYWDKVQRIFEGHQRGYIRYLEGVHRIFGWVLIFERILGMLYIEFHHTHSLLRCQEDKNCNGAFHWQSA